VALLGVDSVMAPIHLREQAWTRLARDLDPKLLASMTTEIGLGEAVDAANERGVAMVFTGVRHFRH
jgi:acrylyl-CoA reductase (NADPH)